MIGGYVGRVAAEAGVPELYEARTLCGTEEGRRASGKGGTKWYRLHVLFAAASR